MQLSIDRTILPEFIQHRVQRALYSLWQARCRAAQIPLWPSLPCHLLGPFLSDTCVIGLSDTEPMCYLHRQRGGDPAAGLQQPRSNARQALRSSH